MNRIGRTRWITIYIYSLDPLTPLSVDTLGPLKEDDLGNRFIIVIVDNFSKLVGLYPARNTTSKEFVHTLLQWVSIFGVLKRFAQMRALRFQAVFHPTNLLYWVITI